MSNFVSFKQMSEWGLITKINNEILHPLGLALSYDKDNDVSYGCVIDFSDYKFEYSEETIKRNNEKFKNFLENRIELLNYYK